MRWRLALPECWKKEPRARQTSLIAAPRESVTPRIPPRSCRAIDDGVWPLPRSSTRPRVSRARPRLAEEEGFQHVDVGHIYLAA